MTLYILIHTTNKFGMTSGIYTYIYGINIRLNNYYDCDNVDVILHVFTWECI